MSDFSINLNTAEIQAKVVEAVVGSVVGEQIQAAVNEALKPRGWDGRGRSVIQDAVDRAVNDAVVVAVRKEVREGEVSQRIKDAVREALTDERIKEITDSVVQRMTLIEVDPDGGRLR